MTGQNGVSERRYRMVVAKVGENRYAVLSLNSTSGKPSQYVVVYNGSRFMCNCPDFLKHMDKPYYACKHVQAVYEALRWFVEDVDMAVDVEITKKQYVRSNGGNGRQDNVEEEEKPLLIEKKPRLFWDE